ncbi:MAG: DHH family phosphoesterase [Flavobacteriales bacterium]|nr:DHH family phosphoesterase [Flavobacteriales bacterium]
MTKRWRLKPPVDPEVVAGLTHTRSTPELATLLAQRGIHTPAEAKGFYHPRIEHLHDPFLMKDMDRAVERINQALRDKEGIMVYGDYDVDGTTSVALVYSVLSRCTGDIMYYIPDRYAEGYGISSLGIDRAAEKGISLIIALDCGIKSVDKVAYANERGIDFIICDHHLPGETIPDAVAVLDPKRSDCAYPFKELSGCGIGFKLMQAFAQQNDMPFGEVGELLDLVAVSIGCDIVPLDGENRTLAHFGLKGLNDREPRPGIKAILGMSNFKRRLSIMDLVFVLGPRINAAGRIEHGQQAVELLLAKTDNEAENIGRRIDGNNSARQDLDKSITEEALGLFETDAFLKGSWSTVVFNPNWHKGVVGIVASRLIEQHYRPTVVLTESNGKVSFRLRFEEVVRETIEPSMRIPEEEVDLEIGLSEIQPPFIRGIDGMEPFGPCNMKPVFLTRGVIAKDVRLLGTGGDHLKFKVAHPKSPKVELDAIAFRQGEHFDLLRSGEPFSMLYAIEQNHWQGKVSTQLSVKDIKPGIAGVLEDEEGATMETATA